MNNEKNKIEEQLAGREEMDEENSQTSEGQSESIDSAATRKNKWYFVGALGAISIVLLGTAAWYFFLRGEGGKPVPPPRNVSFGNESSSSARLSAEGQSITLTEEQLRAADLKIVAVGETMEASSASSTTTGVVEANEYAETPVISQVGGVVKEINAELGQTVRRGDVIAIVSSEELAQDQSKYLSINAELEESRNRYQRALGLSRISEESRNELDKTTATLKSAEAILVEARSNHKRSKKLVEIGAISRREYEKTTTELRVAEANVREAKNRFDRARKLLDINPARKNEIDRYLTRVRSIEADAAAAREKLLVLGLSRGRVRSLKRPEQISARLPIRSPISGTVTSRIANTGEVVSANARLVEVTDLSAVWVIGQVYEKDLGRLTIGSGASVTTDTYSGEVFRGNIAYIDTSLDEKTRTAKVRIELPNPGQKLKLGMFVNVAYSRLGGSEKTSPLVPKAAVQTIGDQKFVFVSTDDPRVFALKPVKLGELKVDSYPVTEGIFVGDRVVTDGSFLLRAEWLKTNPSNL